MFHNTADVMFPVCDVAKEPVDVRYCCGSCAYPHHLSTDRRCEDVLCGWMGSGMGCLVEKEDVDVHPDPTKV